MQQTRSKREFMFSKICSIFQESNIERNIFTLKSFPADINCGGRTLRVNFFSNCPNRQQVCSSKNFFLRNFKKIESEKYRYVNFPSHFKTYRRCDLASLLPQSFWSSCSSHFCWKYIQHHVHHSPVELFSTNVKYSAWECTRDYILCIYYIILIWYFWYYIFY